MSQQERSWRDPAKPCGYIGAFRGMMGIRDAIIFSHCPPGCRAWPLFVYGYSIPKVLELPFTGMYEPDIIFGGEERLLKSLLATYKLYRPNAIFVTTACAPAITGDDIKSVSERVATTLSQNGIEIEVVPVETAGFKEDAIGGSNTASKSIIDHITTAPKEKIPNSVNVIGIPLAEFCGEDDAIEIKGLLERIGLKVNCVFPAISTVSEIRNMSNVEFNVLASESEGVECAKLMEQKFGIPYINAEELPPYGFSATEDWILNIAKKFDLVRKAESVIKKEGREFTRRFVNGIAMYQWFANTRVAIFAPPTRAIGLANATCEAGMKPALICTLGKGGATTKRLLEKVVDKYGVEPKIMLDPDSLDIYEAIRGVKIDIILGSSFMKFVAGALRIPFVNVTYPVFDTVILSHQPLMGFTGFKIFIERVANPLFQGAAGEALGHIRPMVQYDYTKFLK